jgi:hypothetical protein
MGPYPTLRFGGACGLGVGAFDLGSAIVVGCTIEINLRNMVMQIFYVKLMSSLFCLLLCCRPLTGVLADKRYVFY